MTEENKTDTKKNPKRKYVTRWCLHGVSLDDNPGLQSALDNGYEPFAIISQFIPPEKPKTELTLPNTPSNQLSVKVVQVLYFRMKYRVPVDANGKELSQVIYKRKQKDGTEPKTEQKDVSNVTELKPKTETNI